jgi:signal transduction histidine kinase
VQLSVQDNGAGIAAQHLDRVFDPFFTTRLGQGGSGLGLNIVYNIVTQTLGGTIRAESVSGQGARFILDLPCAAPQRAAQDASDVTT